MRHYKHFYINGQWVEPCEPDELNVINPSDESIAGVISLGSNADVDKAVTAAKAAFPKFSVSQPKERLELLENILTEFTRRYDEIATAITEEMGSPAIFALEEQAACGNGHLEAAITALASFRFVERKGNTQVCKEPIGVCALITPWNWPINQIVCKVAPALAMGCTMVLKPSEIAPFSAYLFAEVLHKAGVPAGVFNLVNGDGATVGTALAAHPEVDMVSFTGSTRAGIDVAQTAAISVKRVTQELGGKSPNIILEDADLETAVTTGVQSCFSNSGQSCNAPTRLLIPEPLHDKATEIAVATANKLVVGDPNQSTTSLGPVVSQQHFEKIQRLIRIGIEEGCELACGGLGLPDGLEQGYFVRPTIFCNVDNGASIAKEEIFGPVLVIIPYRDEQDAIRIANDTPYGLCAYVSGGPKRALEIASHLRAGSVHLNGDEGSFEAPFGGYKQSGNGREFAEYGFEDYLELKAIMGMEAQTQ
jgi:aldehyde dehydrogenase (NAD+)